MVPVPRRAARLRALAADAALVLSVVGLLAALQFLLPRPVRAALYFRHDLSRPWTLLTAAYVHGDAGHLARNALGYLLAAAYAYALCVGAGERRWFRRTLPVFLLVLPVLVDLASYVAFAAGYPSVALTNKGFSGVVGGVAGFVLVALYVYVRARRSAAAALTVSVSVLSLCLLSVDARYAGGLRPGMTGLVAAGIALTGGHTAIVGRERGRRSAPRREGGGERRGVRRDAAVVALACVALGVLTVGLFPRPSALVRDGALVNVLAHAAGFFLGIGLSAATLVVGRRGVV